MTHSTDPTRSTQKFDVVVLGAGIVGALLAHILSRCQLSVALIDAKADIMPSDTPKKIGDQRAIALSRASLNILQGLGLWPLAEPMGVAINRVHVCQQGTFGQVRLSAQHAQVESLGHVLNIEDLQRLIAQDLHQKVQVYPEHRVTALIEADNQVTITAATPDQTEVDFSAPWVIAADGAASNVSQLLAMKSEQKSYVQVAIVSNITVKRDHAHIAYERFTIEGPIALLPIAPRTFSLIWCMQEARAQALLEEGDQAFLSILQTAFGYRAGRFIATTPRQTFPLNSIWLPEIQEGRVLFFGNAAHTLHPIAGQGFNLCVREAATLMEALQQQQKTAGDWRDLAFLAFAVEKMQADATSTRHTVDQLVTGFSNAYCGWSILRALGLAVAERSPSLKQKLQQRMMGYRIPASRLARGLKS